MALVKITRNDDNDKIVAGVEFDDCDLTENPDDVIIDWMTENDFDIAEHGWIVIS